ncbi:MAG: hypothetical protein K2N87_12855 [Eubacterium sp.]|nr:hypothetical protein [Eubacterium sp.]
MQEIKIEDEITKMNKSCYKKDTSCKAIQKTDISSVWLSFCSVSFCSSKQLVSEDTKGEGVRWKDVTRSIIIWILRT